MVHVTERKDKKKENVGLHPVPAVMFVKTHLGDCLFGVNVRSAMLIAIDAITFMGANHRIILCKDSVVDKHIVPMMMSIIMLNMHVCKAVLDEVSSLVITWTHQL